MQKSGDGNVQLSSVKTGAENAEKVRAYAEKALSENTLKSYRSDLAHFYEWGGSIPATPELVASYLAEYAGELAVSTLGRRIASINKVHELQGHTSPTKSEIVRLTLKGIRREHSTKQRQAAPLLRDDLIAIINQIDDSLTGLRDKALLMVGFAAALRRSELVALNIEDIEFLSEGAVITLQKSKTDQEGQGRKIAIPKGRSRHCPVQTLQDWIFALGCKDGALFRSIRKGNNIQPDRLSDNAVSAMMKHYVALIGLDEKKYSGHSLRAGFVTSAAQIGIPEWRIMKQSGHKSHATMMRYVRDARLFEDHPLDAMF